MKVRFISIRTFAIIIIIVLAASYFGDAQGTTSTEPADGTSPNPAASPPVQLESTDNEIRMTVAPSDHIIDPIVNGQGLPDPETSSIDPNSTDISTNSTNSTSSIAGMEEMGEEESLSTVIVDGVIPEQEIADGDEESEENEEGNTVQEEIEEEKDSTSTIETNVADDVEEEKSTGEPEEEEKEEKEKEEDENNVIPVVVVEGEASDTTTISEPEEESTSPIVSTTSEPESEVEVLIELSTPDTSTTTEDTDGETSDVGSEDEKEEENEEVKQGETKDQQQFDVTKIWCYRCNSIKDEACDGHGGDFNGDDAYKCDCSNDDCRPVGVKEDIAPVGCLKMVQEVPNHPDKDRRTRIIRQCAYSDEVHEARKTMGHNGIKVWTYQCNDANDCNHASDIGKPNWNSYAFILSTLSSAFVYNLRL